MRHKTSGRVFDYKMQAMVELDKNALTYVLACNKRSKSNVSQQTKQTASLRVLT